MPKGGYRPNSGPKTAKTDLGITRAEIIASGDLTPLAYLLAVMNDPDADEARRDRAAAVAAPFMHAKPGEVGGKKEARKSAADRVADGKFSPASAPRLVVNNAG
jgi:hypothetical protein